MKKGEEIYSYEPLWDNWYIDCMIGEGAFGRVYKVYREGFGKRYEAAVKIISIPQNESEINALLSEGMSREEVKEYFYGIVKSWVLEIEMMDALKSASNIVNIEDYMVKERKDTIGWNIIFRMEYLTSFYEYLQKNTMDRNKVLRLGMDICRALEYCEKLKIIHRDIKPENVFINRFGEFKLGDFGISRQLEKTTSGLSKKGTYAYMAPEVYKGESYNQTVDIYSLGIMLYRFMNWNRTPFLPAYPSSIRYEDKELANERRMAGEELPPPAKEQGVLWQVIKKACAYRSEDRYQNASEMLNDLMKAENDEVVREIPVIPVQSSGIKNQEPEEKINEKMSKIMTDNERTEGTIGAFSKRIPETKGEIRETVTTEVSGKRRWELLVLAVELIVGWILLYFQWKKYFYWGWLNNRGRLWIFTYVTDYLAALLVSGIILTASTKKEIPVRIATVIYVGVNAVIGIINFVSKIGGDLSDLHLYLPLCFLIQLVVYAVPWKEEKKRIPAGLIGLVGIFGILCVIQNAMQGTAVILTILILIYWYLKFIKYGMTENRLGETKKILKVLLIMFLFVEGYNFTVSLITMLL